MSYISNTLYLFLECKNPFRQKEIAPTIFIYLSFPDALFTKVNDTIVDLYAVTMYHSAPEASSLEQTITNVENCQDFCPPQYTVSICYNLGPGLTRVVCPSAALVKCSIEEIYPSDAYNNEILI